MASGALAATEAVDTAQVKAYAFPPGNDSSQPGYLLPVTLPSVVYLHGGIINDSPADPVSPMPMKVGERT